MGRGEDDGGGSGGGGSGGGIGKRRRLHTSERAQLHKWGRGEDVIQASGRGKGGAVCKGEAQRGRECIGGWPRAGGKLVKGVTQRWGEGRDGGACAWRRMSRQK